MKAPDNAYAVILAGGGGTRLWPKSRKALPKHLLKLFGKETLLKITYDRIAPIIPKERIFIISLWEYRDLIAAQIPDFPLENIIIEPESKNTALAMGTAAAYVHKENPDAVIINLAADHIYADIKKFQETAISALTIANAEDAIVAIGIRPTYPHTGLGYIRVGDQWESDNDDLKKEVAFLGKGFKEKPDRATAQAFLATGKYLWNANLYCWTTKAILEAFEKYAPEVSSHVQKILKAIDTPDEKKVLASEYGKAENVQIDIAVSEKAKNLLVVPGDFGWSDVGDWKVVYDIQDKNAAGNVVKEEDLYVPIDTKNTLIEGNGRLIVTIGLENIVVVDTEDAILIAHKDRTQEVKKAVEKLKEEKKDDYL